MRRMVILARRPVWQGMLLTLLVALLSACGSSASPVPNAIKGRFDVGGRSLYLECHGNGSPTVVMDAGLGNPHTTWQAVAPALSKLRRTCTYDRANLGSSDAAPKPRTSADVVADLHALLKAAAIAPPYILVGHSFGGDNVRLFASDYPADVAGLVLVDPTPTNFLAEECAVVRADVCDKLRQGFDPSRNPEGLAFLASAPQVEAAGPLPPVPLVVLAATGHQQAAITDPAIQTQIELLWRQAEAALAASVPGGKLEVISSGHNIETVHPEAVISAVTSVIPSVQPTPSG